MNKTRQRKLEQHGWTAGSAADFLGLTDEESAYIEMKLALSQALRQARLRGNPTQADVAAKLQSSQSRVAKMEASDSTVSVDLLVRSLLALGSGPKDIANAISNSAR